MDTYPLLVILLCLTWLDLRPASATPRFNFTNTVDPYRSCPLIDGTGNWSLEGTLELTKPDLVFFQEKVVVQACSEVCTVDLKKCDGSQRNAGPCSCSGQTDDVYKISIGSEARAGQSGMMVNAIVPSRTPFGRIAATAIIGNMPEVLETRTRVNATLVVDKGVVQTLMPSQTVRVCPNHSVTLEVCVDEAPKGSIIKFTDAKRQEIFGVNSCVAQHFRFDLWEASPMTVKFTYRESHTCPEELVSTILIQENEDSCTRPTTATTPTYVAWDDGACNSTGKDPASAVYEATTLSTGMKVLCDIETDGGNWVVIQRRIQGDINFDRRWADYVRGFGDINGEGDFWFGLENIHTLCFDRPCQLRVDMVYTGKLRQPVLKQANGRYYALYQTFKVAGRSEYYRLTLANYTGTVGDEVNISFGMLYYNGMAFTTTDMDRDINDQINCAKHYQSGFWWRGCDDASAPNGVWGVWGDTGIHWFTLTGFGNESGYESLSSIELKVRPQPSR